MEPLTKLTELLNLRGWRAFFLGLSAFAFIGASRAGYIPSLTDVWVLVVAVVGFICLGLGLASAAEKLAEKYQSYQNRKQAERLILNHKKQFLRDIQNFSEREKEIFGYLRGKNTRSFLAESTGGLAATLVGRGYIERSAKPGQHLLVLETPFLVPEHIWEIVVARPDDFPAGEGRPPWRSRY